LEPFLKINTIDFSGKWQALFDGSVVVEVIFTYPAVKMVVTPTVAEDSPWKQTGEDMDWVQQMQGLMPLTINRFEIRNENLSYQDPSI